ncbi:MAG: CDP-alcohol phosphatidyltransferase family protein [Gemmatimonadetes bacterium]|nr:CDP-alcohol phosphatidyltransferase family protein [Gemmatimonadota bacterium]
MAPFVRALLRAGVTPNTLTTVGALLILASAVAFGAGAIRWGGLLLLISGMIDTLDGQVARLGGQESRFGAFYDSTLDRVGMGRRSSGSPPILCGRRMSGGGMGGGVVHGRDRRRPVGVVHARPCGRARPGVQGRDRPAG